MVKERSEVRGQVAESVFNLTSDLLSPMLSSLDRKLFRDLTHMKGQSLAIALVIAAGVATFVNSQSMLHSLELTRATFYDRYRFAHVFANVKRAPDTLVARIAEIPGVASVETRIVEGG